MHPRGSGKYKKARGAGCKVACFASAGPIQRYIGEKRAEAPVLRTMGQHGFHSGRRERAGFRTGCASDFL